MGSIMRVAFVILGWRFLGYHLLGKGLLNHPKAYRRIAHTSEWANLLEGEYFTSGGSSLFQDRYPQRVMNDAFEAAAYNISKT